MCGVFGTCIDDRIFLQPITPDLRYDREAIRNTVTELEERLCDRCRAGWRDVQAVESRPPERDEVVWEVLLLASVRVLLVDGRLESRGWQVLLVVRHVRAREGIAREHGARWSCWHVV